MHRLLLFVVTFYSAILSLEPPPLVNFQPALDASLILSIEVEVETVVKKKRKISTQSYSLSGVAISRKRAVTALHGCFQLGTQVKVITRNGTVLFGRVEFEEFAPDMVDIATIALEDEFEFTHFIECSFERVQLLQKLVVIGLKYGSCGDAVFPYARSTSVEMIEEVGDDSALFQASYYSFDGCSGAGVVTKVVNSIPKLIGVHVASHEDSSSTGAVKRKRKATFANFEADIRSEIHGHKAYSLVCEIARVPSLTTLLSSSDTLVRILGEATW
jgi:hypothetical protein